MVQQWRDLAYIHWRYDPATVQALLPPGLEVDTFDGSAWVGLIPFSMRGITVPHMPAVPYFGSFPAHGTSAGDRPEHRRSGRAARAVW